MKRIEACSVLVTDRLHGMIFAYITGTPCIVMDNKTNKVFGVYEEWLSDVDWIYQLKNTLNTSDLIPFINSVKNSSDYKRSRKVCFNRLQEIIQEWKR